LKIVFATAAYMGCVIASTQANGLTFNFIPDPGTTTQVVTAFEEAANEWERTLADDIVVNVTIRYVSSSSGALAGAHPTEFQSSYVEFRDALNSQSGFNSSGVTLPSTDSLDILINRTQELSGARWRDNDANANNTTILNSTASAKALGMLNRDAEEVDCDVELYSRANWDYVDADGVSEDSYSVKITLIHELGHCLGFVSGIDDLILHHGKWPGERYTFVTPLDICRRSELSRSLGSDVIDFTADDRSKYVPWASNLEEGGLSTGYFFGDRRQASHWKDQFAGSMSKQLGNMQPAVYNGVAYPNRETGVSPLDLRAFKGCLGYELVESAVLAADASSATTASADVVEAPHSAKADIPDRPENEVILRYSEIHPQIGNQNDVPTLIVYDDRMAVSYTPKYFVDAGVRRIQLSPEEYEKLLLEAPLIEAGEIYAPKLPEKLELGHGSWVRIEVYPNRKKAEATPTFLSQPSESAATVGAIEAQPEQSLLLKLEQLIKDERLRP